MERAYKKMTSHGSISIPVAMRRELGIEGKDPMVVEQAGGKIVISPYTLRCNFCGATEDDEGVWNAKVTATTETKYKYNPKLERMLKAIFTGDYTFEENLEGFLDKMSLKPDEQQKKLLLKKLKGEFEKDKETLISILVQEGEVAPDFDVELWYIYQIKNGELIRAFLPKADFEKNIEAIKSSIFVETKTSIAIDYEDEEE